eukprot:SM000100S09413  [mRNA]  locus=s100:240137:243271:+ [translate_table: standard]
MKIAVEGCAHGDLDNIFATLQHLEQVESIKVDLLICCGDFQAVRNEHDLETMACPAKYRTMNTFWKYYSGEAVAPILTIFIGGNHEAQNHLWELSYGGWVAPNIYYLGAAGVVKFGGIRIGGLSGIYKPQDYHQGEHPSPTNTTRLKMGCIQPLTAPRLLGWHVPASLSPSPNTGHHERPPYDYQSMRSSYHIRSFDVGKLKLLKEPINIFVSHDWPNGIWEHGNVHELVRRKPFFKSDIDSGRLGSQPSSGLLHHLQPSYWFSAHLHVRFAAVVRHPSGQLTKFLALDKCLPNRNFLQASHVRNPQMLDFLELLGLPYIFNGDSQSASQQSVMMIVTGALPVIILEVICAGSEGYINPEEIELPEEDESAD